MMNSIIRAAVILLLIPNIGCSKDDPSIKLADKGILKTQLETLEQAKQVEQSIQDAAEQQRQKIEQQTQ
jgi:hypothetical protein